MLLEFARMLGIRRDQAEDALTSERVARAVLSRRSALTAAALVGSRVFSIPKLSPVVHFGSFTMYYNGQKLTELTSVTYQTWDKDGEWFDLFPSRSVEISFG